MKIAEEKLIPTKFVRCDTCKFWEAAKYLFEDNHGYCRQGDLAWWGSGGEYGFSCPSDFFCKFWEGEK